MGVGCGCVLCLLCCAGGGGEKVLRWREGAAAVRTATVTAHDSNSAHCAISI